VNHHVLAIFLACNTHCQANKSNPHKDLPPFTTRQSHERFTLLRVAEA
jgi:hypothetical protein